MSDEIARSLSQDRFLTYLEASGHDAGRALRLYLWNAEAGAAFHLPIQCVEVCLRNVLASRLSERFGSDWWSIGECLAFLDPGSRNNLLRVCVQLSRRGEPVGRHIVPAMSFGFWTGLLRPSAAASLWPDGFQSPFNADASHLPLAEVQHAAFHVATLRNRISHHEPIIRRDLLADYSIAMRLLKWLSPATHDWVRPYCRVPAIVRQKP